MSQSSRHLSRSVVTGAASFTPATHPDLNIRYPNNGHGQATGTDTLSAVLNTTLCSIYGIWIHRASPTSAGRMSIQSHDGLTTWISLRIPASVSADVYYRFGEAGILVPGAFRFLWTADTPGGAGPALYTAFYQDLVERLVN